MTATIDNLALAGTVGEVLGRWPVAGMAVAVVRQGSPPWLWVRGFADVERRAPVDEHTVFRIGSITKTMTAIAVMQVVDDGAVDLDAPVTHYLHVFRLVPATAGLPPVTLRHLLTHTAGVHAVRTAADLLRPTLGWGVRADRQVPPLAAYYRGGLRVDAVPGSRFAYSNHGFAVLGQVVEDVTGVPFHRYLRERVLDPLGMRHSDVVRSERVVSRLATGYELGSRGLRAVVDREMVTAGGGGAYSCLRTWRATPQLSSTAAPVCSGQARWPRCSSRSTGRTRVCRAWGWPSSGTTPRPPRGVSRRDLEGVPLQHGARAGRRRGRDRPGQHRALPHRRPAAAGAVAGPVRPVHPRAWRARRSPAQDALRGRSPSGGPPPPPQHARARHAVGVPVAP